MDLLKRWSGLTGRFSPYICSDDLEFIEFVLLPAMGLGNRWITKSVVVASTVEPLSIAALCVEQLKV
ncbi:hypothetical protein GCM10025791_23630 [Halioxenophilus aromaticivorans]|uniref:Uncharacterized protein n=1 Tax=Halioxenophilus aromaticivorans TaxID=1306992 RepID=A0AAV3U3D1_9ALTE